MASRIEQARMAREQALWAHVSHGWCDHRPEARLRAAEPAEAGFRPFTVDPSWYESHWLVERPSPPPGVARRVVGWLVGRIGSAVGHVAAAAAARAGSLGRRRASGIVPARPAGSMR
jgi:hypothetical protein